MLRVVAWVIKFTKVIWGKSNKTPHTEMLLAEDLKEAETVVLKLYQKIEFKDAYKILNEVKTQEGQNLENRLECLNPFMDESGFIRVGGRLKKSSGIWCSTSSSSIKGGECNKDDCKVVSWKGSSWWEKHHTHWPYKFRLLVDERKLSTQRDNIKVCHVQTSKRERWVVVHADLPSDRLQEEPPFSYCRADIFRPFNITESWNTLKC